MPELPEVKNVRDNLNKIIKNKIIKKININLNKIIKNTTTQSFKEKIENRKIQNVSNYGKWLSINLENEYHILIHLKLEGKFRNKEGDEKQKKHDHVVFVFNDNSKLFFNDTRQFAAFYLIKGDVETQIPIKKLSKEPNKIDINWLLNKFKNKTIPIKSSLLDQQLVVGLGNIYVNEVLWYEKINPFKKTNLITKKELKGILKRSHKIMEESYKLGGSTIRSYNSLNDKSGKYQEKLRVHLKENEKCINCQNKIRKEKVGGRGTYYCPNCQK